MRIRTALAAILFACFLTPLAGTAAEAGRVFQNFMLEDLNGKKVDLYQEAKDKGKVIILDLFATWCPPCRMEIPDFIELQKQYTNELMVIGVGFDQNDPVTTLKAFIPKMGINYRVLVGSHDLADYVQLRGIPRTFILASDFHGPAGLAGCPDQEGLRDLHRPGEKGGQRHEGQGRQEREEVGVLSVVVLAF